jgi:hypothetical protein
MLPKFGNEIAEMAQIAVGSLRSTVACCYRALFAHRPTSFERHLRRLVGMDARLAWSGRQSYQVSLEYHNAIRYLAGR